MVLIVVDEVRHKLCAGVYMVEVGVGDDCWLDECADQLVNPALVGGS